MRATEIQTHIPVYDAYFGVGKIGKALRKQWKQRVSDWAAKSRGRAARLEKDEDITAFWQAVRSINGSTRYQECQITTRSSTYRASKRS